MIRIENVSKSFRQEDGIDKLVLDNISFEIKSGEFITIFGPNGSGKSTLLNLLAKLMKTSQGIIEFENTKEVSAYIFQDYKANLLPWKNVWQNVAQPLLWQNLSKTESRKKVEVLFEKLKINVPMGAFPYTLSGGQAQLVSILRSVIIEPSLLLADEPFSALDLMNRWKLSIVLRDLWLELKFKSVFVSHDIDEAIFLGNRLILLSKMPTRIKKIFDINLPEKRTKEILTSPEFIKIKESILSEMQF